MKNKRSFETLAAQAGLRQDQGDWIPTSPPIVPSTTYTYESIEDVHAALEPGNPGFAYARNANPTVQTLEHACAELEEAEEVVAFASGMAAVHAAMLGTGAGSGDTILAASDIYGVTRALLVQLADFDIQVEFIDMLDLDAVERALEDFKPRAVFLESVTNPLLKVADVAAVAALAERNRAALIVDNTFASPYLFRPLDIGAAIVVHSATKYLAGHGDVTAGLVATSRSFGARVRQVRAITGAVISPFDAWLSLRGMRTLAIRMDRQCQSASEVARWLLSREWVRRVYYPGLEDHPQHALANRQFGGQFGAMIAFDLAGDVEDTLAFIDALQLITPGTSLGDVESLVLYPPRSSHRQLSNEQLRASGIGESLVRLSVGLESVDDLQEDLANAAGAIAGRRPAVSGSGRPEGF